jgi:hypothetical protein
MIEDRIDPRDPDVRVTPLPPMVAAPPPPKFIRKAGDIRKDIIRAYLKQGITDPAKIGKAEKCTKELILYYARRMDDVVVEIYQPAPGIRSKARIIWKPVTY